MWVVRSHARHFLQALLTKPNIWVDQDAPAGPPPHRTKTPPASSIHAAPLVEPAPGKISTGEPEHIGHRIKARLLVPAPERGLHGAARENAAIFRDMGEFDSFARPRENHLVIPDHSPAAQRRKADISDFAQAGVTVARANRMLFEFDATPFRRRFAEEKRGAGWRIDLHAVMHFDDLDVVFGPERAGDPFDERGKEIDPKAHVARAHDDGMARGGL